MSSPTHMSDIDPFSSPLDSSSPLAHSSTSPLHSSPSRLSSPSPSPSPLHSDLLVEDVLPLPLPPIIGNTNKSSHSSGHSRKKKSSSVKSSSANNNQLAEGGMGGGGNRSSHAASSSSSETKSSSHSSSHASSSSSSSSHRKKKKGDDEIIFDETKLFDPLPIGLKLYCVHGSPPRYHHCKILDRRSNSPSHLPVNCRSLADLGGASFLPSHLASMDFHSHPNIYYIHYTEWDRRMDEWTTRDRMLLISQIKDIQQSFYSNRGEQREKEEKEKEKEKEGEGAGGGGTHEESKEGTHASSSSHLSSSTSMDIDSGSSSHPTVESLIVKPSSLADDGHHGGHGNFSADDLHAHEEATKVKNIDSIQIGKYRMDTWYYSPLPAEYNQYSVLHFCEFCFAFFGFEEELKRHSKKCHLRHPPGVEIYRSDERNVTVSYFEVDGAKERVYCENLCYIAKFFLDHKTLEFDCSPFLFYILCEVDSLGYHMVGYFSKEKVSLTNYNLACILCLPCHQRKGYGKVLISLSYELSKIEEKPGSPEKPISDLGKLSYMAYWTNTLVKCIHDKYEQKTMVEDAISLEELQRITCITTDDIIEALKAVHVLVWYKGKWVFSETNINKVLEEKKEKEEKGRRALEADPNAIFVAQVRPEKLSWTPFFAIKKARQLFGGV